MFIKVKKFLDYLYQWYTSNYHLVMISSLFSALLLLLYRIEIYSLINSIYSDILSLNFFSYLFISRQYDAGIFLLITTISLCLLKNYRISEKNRFISFIVFYSIISAALIASIEFFKTYETTFHLDFWSRETTSGFYNVIRSAFAETSVFFYIQNILFLIIGIVVIKYREKLLLLERVHTKVIHGFTLGILIAAITAIPVITILPRGTEGIVSAGTRSAKLAQELSMNPIYNAILPQLLESGSETMISELDMVVGQDLNTNSLVSGQVFPKFKQIPRGKKYNILLYFFESTPKKYLHIKHKGKDIAPNFVAMHKNSFIAENHYANAPLSSCSLFSILSSEYDSSTKNPTTLDYPDFPVKTLPEILKEKGYRTFLIHTGDLRYANQRNFLKNRKIDKLIEYRNLTAYDTEYMDIGWGVDDRALLRPTINFMKKEQNKPFFSVVMPVNPHHPYETPGPEFNIVKDIPGTLHYKKRNFLNYQNSLHYSDAVLGKLIKQMKKENLLKDTLIFVFADHGEAFYEHHQNYNHPFFLYEENVHVPFIIYNPYIFKNSVSFKGVTQHVDIMPTILDILNIKHQSHQAGTSMLSGHREQLALLHTDWKDKYIGLRDGKWKFILRIDDGTQELYDLNQDPDEKVNIAELHPELAARFKKYIVRAQGQKITYYKSLLQKNKKSNIQ